MKLIDIYSKASGLVAFRDCARGSHKTFYRKNIAPIVEDLAEFEQERKLLLAEDNIDEVEKMGNREIEINVENPLPLSEIESYDISVLQEDQLIELGFVKE